jgi:WD40 repeat protein
MRPADSKTTPQTLLALAWVLLMLATPAPAQDALNLPTELFVLGNDGVLERFGLGATGIDPVAGDGQFIVDFGVAPDGDWLAYRTPDAFVVAEITTGEGIALATNPPLPPTRGAGSTIAWSPDASKIAYTTENGLGVRFRSPEPPLRPGFFAVQAGNDDAPDAFAEVLWSPDGDFLAARRLSDGAWLLYAAERAELRFTAATPPAPSGTWRAPGIFAFAPAAGGLEQVNVGQGNAFADLLPANRRYDALATRPDGRIAGFSRALNTLNNTDPSGRYTLIDPFTRTAEVVSEAELPLTGLRWTPDAALALAFEGGVLVLVNPQTGEGFPLPMTDAVAYDWGRPPLPAVTGYPVAQNLFFVAPDDDGVAQVWQLFRDGSPPLPLTQAEDDVNGYAVSLDGFSIAYNSDNVIFVQRLNDGSAPFPLTRRQSNTPPLMDFSPDGVSLAYTDTGGIWTVPVALQGEAALLIADSPPETAPGDQRRYDTPRYSPNIGALLLDVIYAEGSATGVLDVNSGELLELPFGHVNATWTPDADILTFAGASPFTQGGVQQTALTDLTAPTALLPPSVNVADAMLIYRRRSIDVRLLAAPTPDGPTPLRVFDFRDGAGLVPVLADGFATEPRLSPDGSQVAGYLRVTPDADGLLTGQLTLVDVASGAQVVLETPERVRLVRWQR